MSLRSDVVPSTKPLPLSTDKIAPVRAPALGQGIHNFAPDHTLRQQGHDYGHNTLRQGHDDYDHTTNKPLSLGMQHEPNYAAVGTTANPLKSHMTMRGGDRHALVSTDDSALTKQVLATHAPDIEQLNVKPVLAIIEDILLLGKPVSSDTALVAPLQSHADAVDEKKHLHQDTTKLDAHGTYRDDKAVQASHVGGGHSVLHTTPDHDSEIVRVLAFPINRISCEIICKCASGGEAHSVTMDLLKSLSNYSWEAKVVIAFAAFAINYGEFWLVEHLHTKNPLAKNIATLKDLPEIMEHAGELRKKFESVLDLLNTVLKVTHCIIDFNELPPSYISRESPEMVAATAHIPTAVYWIVRSILSCASILLNLVGSGHEYITSTAESWEILSLGHKLTVIMEHLQGKLTTCKDYIGRKQEEDAYLAFKRLMETSHIDNMKVLRAMIRGRDDQRPIYDGSQRTNERIEALRLKYVLLLITDLDIPHEELNVLHMIYNQSSMRHQYEVLWIPVVNHHNTLTQLQNTVFYDLRNNSMPWFSVDHPSLIEPAAIRYIRDDWNFTHMPMVVVLDPRGRPSNRDALPMMWIWGSDAFDFTVDKEKELWSVNIWNIRLLADSIDPRIPQWITENKVICLYGGEDIEWIRKFTLSARAAANALHVPLEMLYVGKRNPKDKVRRCHEIIDREKLSHIFSLNDYYDYIWFFWVRLWSMWNSKKHIGASVENDNIMKEIMDLLTFDSSEQGWAVFSQGNSFITKAKGDIVLPIFETYNNWAYRVDHPEKFVPVLDEIISGTHPEHHCNRLILPGYAGYIPERVVCSECGKTMDKYVMYRCCTD